jgi:uncharacterized membrane protein
LPGGCNSSPAFGIETGAISDVQSGEVYGIARAGKNDCASTGNNACGGTSKIDRDPKAWIYVPEGYCERIVGGSKTPK